MMTSMGLRFSSSPQRSEARSNQYLGLEAAGEIRGRRRDPLHVLRWRGPRRHGRRIRNRRQVSCERRRRTLLRLCRPETVDNPEADRTLPVSNRTGRRMIAEPENAMVLWSRDDASPAVTAAKFGHGRAVFCDFPLELSLSYEPDAYQRGVYEEIYKDAVSLSKWQEPAWTDSPDVSATVLKSKGDDRCWCWSTSLMSRAMWPYGGPGQPA